MISALQLSYKIDLKLNKVATFDGQEIPIEDKMLALREAEIKLIKQKLGTKTYGEGMDAFKKRYQDLEALVVDYEEITPSKSSTSFPAYKFPLSSLKKKYMFPVAIYALCSRDECKDRVVVVNKMVRHGDMLTVIDSPHWSPSFAYQETLAAISSGDVILYSCDPQGEFKIDKIFISYLRYPIPVDLEGYIHFDGTPSITADSELEDYLEDELINIVVEDLALATNNQEAAQSSQIRKAE